MWDVWLAWMHQVEPIGDERADMRSGRVVQAVIAAAGGRAPELDDTAVRWDHSEPPTEEQNAARWRSFLDG